MQLWHSEMLLRFQEMQRGITILCICLVSYLGNKTDKKRRQNEIENERQNKKASANL
jgi:hypothetical protein